MTDAPDTKRDWRDTVFLPKTDFPMKAGLAAKEPAILERWARLGVYERLREMRAGRERFILHDGPPYANGDIHMGHAMNKVLKDIIVRSRSLMGKDAPYVPGWDCHGLPIEWKVEEAYRARKLNKDDVPVAQFRAECRAYAAKWVDVQREQFKRLGVMGDWDDPYLTMKYEAEAAIVGELLKFAESGQLYRGAKPVMWSPVEKTALAEAEVEYEDIVSTQIDVAFEIVDAPNAPDVEGAHAVVWTTTPWTIPVNQALAYGPEVEYILADRGTGFDGFDGDDQHSFDELLDSTTMHGAMPEAWDYLNAANEKIVPALKATGFDRLPKTVLVARDLLASLNGRLAAIVDKVEWERHGLRGVVIDYTEASPERVFKGHDLAGAVARHPMHHLGGFFAKPRPFLAGDFVTTDAGTGLVHMAPDHGEDDFALCREYGIEPVFAVEGDGKYRADWAWRGGQGSVINKAFISAEGPICSDLREVGALLAASDDYRHSYPHSWRSKAKVIFRATPQWFIPMDASTSLSTDGEDASTSLSTNGSEAVGSRPPFALSEVEGQGSNGATLRETALDAIARTRWVPARAENRITSMVAGRPDWVISRQRAWGVPIALYVHKATGEYLNDPAVNARIVEAFREGGADAWFTADHAALLGPEYDPAEYDPQNDILDVWFDSGSSHAYTIEARYGMDARADLYVEGSDQHRGWFQSSLLESCGTRGRAPYDAVLTHGFALDDKGRKMSKSLGNVVDPLKIIGESGADILRMWVASTDYFEDVKIGKEVLATASDAYRKLRNTFRYLLGALDGFAESERVAVKDMPELERYVLHLLGMLDTELRQAADGFEFNRYLRLLTDFAQEDLSAFFFDIRKDSLYCDAPGDLKRRAYRTVLDTLFHALVRYAAPILCFTAEEVWQARYPSEDGSVHFLEWPEIHEAWKDGALGQKWHHLRGIRSAVTSAIEPFRRDKIVRSSLEADVEIWTPNVADLDDLSSIDFAELCIVSKLVLADEEATRVQVIRTAQLKCGRCWRHLPEVVEDDGLCARCTEVVYA